MLKIILLYLCCNLGLLKEAMESVLCGVIKHVQKGGMGGEEDG